MSLINAYALRTASAATGWQRLPHDAGVTRTAGPMRLSVYAEQHGYSVDVRDTRSPLLAGNAVEAWHNDPAEALALAQRAAAWFTD
ncbi:hypothetical protein [Micromonospora sp. CPCC 206061]|uniref:hypothetical protein n=1 Tax=Micromonospora sp. CPCC 206061 TaxID=3122410 RepID=UPI002FF10F17